MLSSLSHSGNYNKSLLDFERDFDFTGVSAAAGGFLIYPNKANLNMVRSVYAK